MEVEDEWRVIEVDAEIHKQRHRVDRLLIRRLDEAEPGEAFGPLPDHVPHAGIVVEALEPIEQRLSASNRGSRTLVQRRRRIAFGIAIVDVADWKEVEIE